MRGFQKIDSVMSETEFGNLTASEKIELLLTRIRECLLEEAEKMNITFPSYARTSDLLIGLNFIISEYRARKKFNTRFITSILTVMSSIQNSQIKFKTAQDISMRDFPVYIYQDDDRVLIEIRSHNKTDNLNVVLSLLSYLERQFLQDLPSSKKYKFLI